MIFIHNLLNVFSLANKELTVKLIFWKSGQPFDLLVIS